MNIPKWHSAGWRQLVVITILVLGSTVAGPIDRVEAGSPLKLFGGNWSGWGWVEVHSGNRERVRCKSRNKVSGDNHLKQKIRCASTSFKITASLSITSSGSSVRGIWKAASFNSSGNVSGRTNSNGLNLTLSGSSFSAGLSANVKKCKQSLSISISGLEIRRVTMALNKRC